VLGTAPDAEFDRLADLAAALADAPIGLVSFVTEDRQWHKAAVGTDLREIPRPHSFCARAIDTPGPTVIEDLARHEAFADSPYVNGEADEVPALRFYAGAPIVTADGHRLGTVCVLDTEPRSLASETVHRLPHLASLAMEALERRAPAPPSSPPTDRRDDADSAAPDPAAPAPSTPIAVASLTRDLTYDRIHRPHAPLVPEAARGRPIGAHASGPGFDRLRALARRARDRGDPLRAEVTVEADGPATTYDVTVAPRCTDATVTGLTLAALDVTEQRRQTRALRRTRDQLRRTQTVAGVGGWEYHPQADAFTGTEQLYRLLGLPPGTTLTYEEALRFHPPDARARVAAAAERCLTEGGGFDLEVPLVSDTGERRWVRTQAEAHEQDGTVVRVVGTLQDITRRKRQEDRLERQNDLFEKAQEIAQVGAWEYDAVAEGSVLTSQAYAIHGLSPQDALTPEDSLSFYHPDDRPTVRAAFQRALEDGTSYDLEVRLRDAHGRQRWIRTRGEPQTDDGEVVRVRGTLQDITERKEMEATLRRQNKLLSSITENISDGIYRSTPDEGILYANQAFLDMFGYDRLADLKQADPTALYADPSQRAALYRRDDEETPSRAEVEFERNDGSTFTGLITFRRVRNDRENRTYYDGVVTDITDRRRQKEQLEARQHKLEALYEASSRLFGVDDKTEVADLLVTLIGETLGYSGTTIRFVEGNQLAPSRVPAMVRRYMPPRPAYDLEGDAPAAAAYRANETRVFDDLSAERPSLDRGEIRATAYIPMGSHGLISVGSLEVGGISSFDRRLIEVLAGHATLVLDRLDYEDTLRRAKEEAEEANRTKSVLLANINHEFRTPLTSIISASRLLEDNPSLAGSLATRISSGGKRLLYTLNTVMDFAELEGDQTSFSPQRFDVRDVVRSTVDDFREAAARNGVSITTEQPDHPLVVVLDPHYVARICTHLMSNAVKFSEDDGVPIRIGARADGGAAVLWVEDEGIGIDPSFQPHVYDEFSQASSGYDRTHDGNGLGLTITKRLVDRMGGSIDLDSTPGEGTRVTVRLPRSRDETPPE
jgi:PAS domain S-box-containing protein